MQLPPPHLWEPGSVEAGLLTSTHSPPWLLLPCFLHMAPGGPAGASKSCLSCMSVSTTDAAVGAVPSATFGICLSVEKRDAGVYLTVRTSLRLQDSLLFCQKRSLSCQPKG